MESELNLRQLNQVESIRMVAKKASENRKHVPDVVNVIKQLEVSMWGDGDGIEH